MLRAVDYRNLGAEELGSVYESLLELHPELERRRRHVRADDRRRQRAQDDRQLLHADEPDLVPARLGARPGARRGGARRARRRSSTSRSCDPACGSGHFLVAAAHRIAKRLARVRTGDEEPSPEATRHALRDVVGRCLYGVDVNPMAVELCKVSLWMEALEPGRPLSLPRRPHQVRQQPARDDRRAPAQRASPTRRSSRSRATTRRSRRRSASRTS